MRRAQHTAVAPEACLEDAAHLMVRGLMGTLPQGPAEVWTLPNHHKTLIATLALWPHVPEGLFQRAPTGQLLSVAPAEPTHPSEPGLEGVLSEESEETDATDRGREEEGMVKDRTMDRGRLPLLSSRLEG